MFGNGQVNTAVAYGPASGNLIGLDCDSPQRYDEALAMVGGLGISTWIVRRPEVAGDPHNGGGTLFFRTIERAKGRNLADLEVKTGGYSLVPLSRHPSGVDYYTETGCPEEIFTLPSLRALAPWIELRPWRPVPHLTELEAQLPECGKIPSLAWRILVGDAEAIARYHSHSEAEQACLCSLINAGHDFESCLGLFLTHPAAGKFAEKYTRNPRESIAWLGLSYRNAANFVLDNPGEARELAWRLRAWAESQNWAGRTGLTDHAVYLAHLSIVERCGRQPHGASCRELAELARTSPKTAAKANYRLQKSGLLQLAQTATFNLPNRFYLLDVAESAKGNTLSRGTVRECYPMLIQHDAFCWRGLGKTGAKVWAELLERGEATESELTQATRRHESTVRRKLDWMLQLGMVEPLGNGLWQALPGVDLDVVAEALDTAGLGERQKREHQRQRELRQRALERGRFQG